MTLGLSDANVVCLGVDIDRQGLGGWTHLSNMGFGVRKTQAHIFHFLFTRSCMECSVRFDL